MKGRTNKHSLGLKTLLEKCKTQKEIVEMIKVLGLTNLTKIDVANIMTKAATLPKV